MPSPLKGRGGWADDHYTLALENIAASGPRIVPWKLASASRFTASRRDAALEPVCLAYETRRFCFEGRWTAGGAWSVAANTDAFPLEALDPKRRGAPGYRGLLSIDAKASGRAGEPWIADLEAEIRDASLTYQSASGADRTVALGRTRLTLDSDAGRHRLNLRVSDAAEHRPRRGARGDARARSPRSRTCRSAAACRAARGSSTCCRCSSTRSTTLRARPISTSRSPAAWARRCSRVKRASPTARSTSTRRTCACGRSTRRSACRTPPSRSKPRARPATGHSGSTDASAGATAG